MSKKRRYLVYFYKKNFSIRWYDYIFAYDVDDAWITAESLFGKGNIESVSLEPNE